MTNIRTNSHRFLVLFVIVVVLRFGLYSRSFFRSFPSPIDETVSVQTKIIRSVSPRNRTGDWIGHTWIPPSGWQYHTPTELRHLYRGKNILWIGDSTARRASMTLYALLDWSSNSTFLMSDLSDPALIDLTKNSDAECTKRPGAHDRPTICRSVQGGGSVSYVPVACHHDVERFFQHNDTLQVTQEMDLIIVGVGIWEILRQKVCGEANRTLVEVAAAAIESVHKFERVTQKKIIWRTSGYSEHGPILSNAVTELNEMVMDVLDQTTQLEHTGLSYVNWGGAVQSRSALGERIAGDVKAHYGLEPRLVLIEMITNQLHEEGFLT